MTKSNQETYIEERDLPQKLVLTESVFKQPENNWATCYCGEDILWKEPNCGNISCQRRSFGHIIKFLSSYTDEIELVSKIARLVPKILFAIVQSENDIFNSELMLSDDVITQMVEFEYIPLELLLYIYYHKSVRILNKIKNHNQFRNNLLDHILRKKIDSKEINFLNSFPTLIAHIFWEFKEEIKWKQSFQRLLTLPYISEISLTYLLRCSLKSNFEKRLRQKIATNPRILRIVEEARMSSTYQKFAELSVHWYWGVRELIAKNEKTQKRVLEALAESKGYYSKEIKITLIKNPAVAPKIIQSILLNQFDVEIILLALRRPDLSKKTYENFLTSDEPEIRDLALQAVANSSLNTENLFGDEMF